MAPYVSALPISYAIGGISIKKCSLERIIIVHCENSLDLSAAYTNITPIEDWKHQGILQEIAQCRLTGVG